MTGVSINTSADWPRLVRVVFLVAMAVFVVTVVIGILNGLDVVEFDRNQLLTHVHSGTLGWITLTIFAATLWLVRGGDSRLAWTLAILVPIYVAAFYTGNIGARALTGALLLLAIGWLLFWAWSAVGWQSIPRLALVLGLTTFGYGALIGVLIQVQYATGSTIFPGNSNVIGAHAASMTFSYLVLAAMGLIEWRVRGTTDRPAAGVVQMAGLFVGGLLIVLTFLFLPDAIQPIGGLYLLAQLIALILFAVRVLPSAVRVDWVAASARRYIAAAGLFVVVAAAIYLYFVFLAISNPAVDQVAENPGILLASDHAAFIGIVTNLMFGLVLSLTADRRSDWSWADQLVFWGVNGGLIVFIVGLIAEATVLKQIGAPVMGVSVLLGLATLAMRLWSSRLETGATEA